MTAQANSSTDAKQSGGSVRSERRGTEWGSRLFWGYLGRFTLLHVLTYVVVGLLFFYVSDYTTEFANSAMARFMRPTDDPRVALGIPIQILRGALLGVALFPFRRVIVEPWGWLKLWFLLWVLTGVGAVITGPGSIEGWLYTTLSDGLNLLVGWPEITLQMLVFSYLLYGWERRHERNA